MYHIVRRVMKKEAEKLVEVEVEVLQALFTQVTCYLKVGLLMKWDSKLGLLMKWDSKVGLLMKWDSKVGLLMQRECY
jgi:hypothetical protein